MSTIYQKLTTIQNQLKAPKSQHNSFGKYNYRSSEDILEALKPVVRDNNCSFFITDEIINIQERFYVKATVTLVDSESGESISASAFAREPEQKKGADESQVTGASSSYARKYAMNGMFAIDDTKDADTDEHKKTQDKADSKPQPQQQKAVPKSNPQPSAPKSTAKQPNAELKSLVDEIDTLIREKVKVDSAKAKEAVESVLGHGNYKKLDTVENGEKIKQSLSEIKGE
jgi:hypothetical protein